ncbi:CD209 antigen-like protein E [Seriola aureovittata]|uniref:CD209 antigen-like protein E n=1 Tax=Seriola aureovittata TaxID=2871759 RepID=UPI0024BDEA0D|nr:CD209 antigen-like protein E [Seriola aureovittata]
MSVVRPESSMHFYRLVTVSLAVLAVILLAIDIGLGVYYSKLTGQYTITDMNEEMTKLQAFYNSAVKSRDDAKKELAKEISEHLHTEWELDHQTKRNKGYEKDINKIQEEISAMKAHIPMIAEGCRHCLPGWTYMNSACYYIATSEALSRRPWHQARQFCINQGGDLAILDTTEKNVAVNSLINNYHDSSRFISLNGYWIGLRDIDEEGTWKWLDGRRMTEGYWNDGEPNNQDNEDCAATYPKNNPFKSWNDAPCGYSLKWICEMAPKSGS